MFKNFLNSFENPRQSYTYAVITFTIIVIFNISLITKIIFHKSLISETIVEHVLAIDLGFISGITLCYSIFRSYFRVRKPQVSDDELVAMDDDVHILGKRDQQHQVILAVINALKYDPLKIPTGGKAKVRDICLMRVKVFTESAFDHAWKDGTKLGLFRLEESDKFSSK